MEPLPTQGQTLRHYTASRPRPRRIHSQPPSTRAQEPLSKLDDQAAEGMGRVDEGVEEFFTKKILPDYPLKGQWEESQPVQATPPESSSTPPVSTPFSPSSESITSFSITCVTSPLTSTNTTLTSADVSPVSPSSTQPFVTTTSITSSTSITISSTPPTRNIKKTFGDFFAFKRARVGRVSKAGGGEGGGKGGGVKRPTFADLIRPLREAKERERGREKVLLEKEKGGRSEEDANISNNATITEGTIATSHHPAGAERERMTLTMTAPPSERALFHPIITTSPNFTTISDLEEFARHTSGPAIRPLPTELETPFVRSPYGERRLKVTKRTLREGKSQSLILLTGLEPDDRDVMPSKKHASESTSSIEHKQQDMLNRMGVAKTPPADAKMNQNKDEELRKINSEGAIRDKPAPPITSMKPRTTPSSSADPGKPVRTQNDLQPDLVLYPKPGLLEHPVSPLTSKPAIAAKPSVPSAAAPSGGGVPPSNAAPAARPTVRSQLGANTQDENQEGPRGASSTPSPKKEVLYPTQYPWRSPNAQDRCEKAQSASEESLPKPRQHMKPPSQRRAVSVHEDTLALTQELKAVLQRSPVCFRGLKGDRPLCAQDQLSGENAQGAKVRYTGKPSDKETKDAVQREELKTVSGRTSCRCTAPETKHLPPGDREFPGSSTTQSQQETFRPFSPPTALENPPTQTKTLEKSHMIPTLQRKSPNKDPTVKDLHVCPLQQENPPSTISDSPESSKVPILSPLSHKNSPRTRSREALSQQHTTEDRRETHLSK